MKKTCINCSFFKEEKYLDGYQDCWRGCPMVKYNYEACPLWQSSEDWTVYTLNNRRVMIKKEKVK